MPTPDRWTQTHDYLRHVFADEPNALASIMPRAREAGLPNIAVPPETGRWLALLARFARAQLAVELGTLAGYSAAWLLRGMPDSGRLIAVEPEPAHADLALANLRSLGFGDRVTLRREPALDALAALERELGPASIDLLFADAIKPEYPAYFDFARRLLRPGGLFITDNALGSDEWWIGDDPGTHPSRDGSDRCNRAAADDPQFDAVMLPVGSGLLVARRLEPGQPRLQG